MAAPRVPKYFCTMPSDGNSRNHASAIPASSGRADRAELLMNPCPSGLAERRLGPEDPQILGFQILKFSSLDDFPGDDHPLRFRRALIDFCRADVAKEALDERAAAVAGGSKHLHRLVRS